MLLIDIVFSFILGGMIFILGFITAGASAYRLIIKNAYRENYLIQINGNYYKSVCMNDPVSLAQFSKATEKFRC